MKPLLHILLSLLILSSCMISTDVVYNDPNYLKSTEFKEYNEIISERNQVIDNDSIVQSENYESEDGYYYHDYSSNKKIHRPLFYSDYYSGFYTGYNYYNYDPYWDFNYPYYNSSIYFGYQFFLIVLDIIIIHITMNASWIPLESSLSIILYIIKKL